MAGSRLFQTMLLAKRIFQIDVRSLAALRIGLAVVMLGDLINRWQSAATFLSDEGVLPRALFHQIFDASYWSLYLWNGSLPFVRFLLLAHVFAAVSLLLGYRTKLATFVCLILLWSVQARNPLITTGGDVLLRVLMAWMLLLPTSACWCMDSRKNRGLLNNNRTVCSLATAGVLLQVGMMYFFAGLAKFNTYWIDGDVIAYCLQLEMYVKPAGYLIADSPTVMRLMTWGTLGLELAGPVLLFSPVKTVALRTCLMAAFWGLHVGIFLTFSIGLFSIVAMVAWTVFIPAAFWDRWSASPKRLNIKAAESLPTPSMVGNLLAGGLLLFGIAINVAHSMPASPKAEVARNALSELGRLGMVVQEFNMFGKPPLFSPRFAYRAQLRDGAVVDLFSQQPLDPEQRGLAVYRWARTQFWRRYHTNLMPGFDQPISATGAEAFKKLRQQLLLSFVNKWNKAHVSDQQVNQAELFCTIRTISVDHVDVRETNQTWASYPEQ